MGNNETFSKQETFSNILEKACSGSLNIQAHSLGCLSPNAPPALSTWSRSHVTGVHRTPGGGG